MNFHEIYEGMVGMERENRVEPNPPPDDTSRVAWLNHPHTVELAQTLLTLSKGYLSYSVGVGGEFEGHKERIKEALHKVNVLMNVHKYMIDGDFKQLVRGLNFIEKV